MSIVQICFINRIFSYCGKIQQTVQYTRILSGMICWFQFTSAVCCHCILNLLWHSLLTTGTGAHYKHININSLWSVQFILTASWLCQSTTDIVTAPLRLKSSDSDPVLVTILQPIWAFQLLSSCMKCFDFTLSKFSCFVRVSSNKKILNHGFLILI